MAVEGLIVTVTDVVIIATLVVGIGGAIIGFILRNQKTIDDIRKLSNQNEHCIQRIEDKIDDHITEAAKTENSLNMQIQEHKMDMIKYRDELRVEIKQLGSRIDTLTEKVLESEKIHVEIKNMIDDQKNFTIDWNQRIEDRIQNILDFLMSERSKGNYTGSHGGAGATG